MRLERERNENNPALSRAEKFKFMYTPESRVAASASAASVVAVYLWEPQTDADVVRVW